MSDNESRMEDARIEALIEKGLRNGTMVEAECCGNIISKATATQCEECEDYLCKKHNQLFQVEDKLVCHLCKELYEAEKEN